MMIATLSPNGQNTNRGDASPTQLFVATLRGVHLLVRTVPGAPWTDRGLALPGHHCGSLLFEPRSGTVFAGMHSGGLYASADAGKSWEERTRGITIPHVFSLAAAYANGATVVYAGTEPASIFKSADGGTSWTEVPGIKTAPGREKWSFPSPPHEAHVKMMAIDPRDPLTIYAGVEQGDLLKTNDGGASWRVIDDYSKPTDWTYRDIHLLVVHPSNSAELFMTTGMGLYHSLDAGETWKLIVDNSFRIAYPDHLIVSPLDGDVLFMAGAATNPGVWRESRRADATIVKSRDRGRNWTDASVGLPADRRPNIEAMSVASYPGGFTLFAGTTDGEIFASDDGADHWELIGARLAPVSKGNHYRSLQPA
jgi:photosystem II stability/assembly factor-like uncharacterized protein